MPDPLPPKPNLMTMPTEMLLEIIRVTEQGSLLAFARCTKRLNSLITPYIYQSIHFVNTSKYKYARYPDWGSKHPKNCQTFGRGFRADIRVYDIDKLLQTISSSRKLRSAIGAASFVWRDCVRFDEDILCITNLLDKKGFKLHMSLPLDYTFQFPWPKGLRSLELSLTNYLPSSKSTGRRLYEIFCQTNLEQLTLKDIEEWGDLRVPFDKYSPRMSGLKCLQLLNSSFPVDRASPIFTWPSALHSFRQDGYHYRSMPVNLSHWVETLYSHRKSLEELFVSIDHFYLSCIGLSTGPSLRAFENIKLLGVPSEFFKKKQGSFFTYVDSHQILPPMLEVLQVELPERYEWDPQLERRMEEEPEYDKAYVPPLELCNWIMQVAQNKYSHYPRLKKFTIWQKCAALYKNMEIITHETIWTHILEDFEGFAETRIVCLLADINLSWITCNFPPHFCASSGQR